MTEPKILFIDIETSPNKGYFFQLFKENTNFETIAQERSILTFSYRWSTDKTAKGISVLTFHNKKEPFNPYDDRKIVERICEIIGKADYVVGHYADKFDMRFIRARALINNLPPLAPVPVIDTYKLCKKYFNLNANRLDYIGKILGQGRKIPMSWTNWQRCVNGEKYAIQEMLRYNKQDVNLLYDVFYKILPHVETNINRKLFSGNCPACGGEEVFKRGFLYTKTGRKQRWQCKNCSSWFSTKEKL